MCILHIYVILKRTRTESPKKLYPSRIPLVCINYICMYKVVCVCVCVWDTPIVFSPVLTSPQSRRGKYERKKKLKRFPSLRPIPDSVVFETRIKSALYRIGAHVQYNIIYTSCSALYILLLYCRYLLLIFSYYMH